MQQEFFSFGHQDEEIIKRYEDMQQSNRIAYFDVEEFESIVEHYLENMKFTKAFQVMEQAIKQHPNSTVLDLLVAKVYLRQGKLQKSGRILERIESLMRNDTDYWMLRGELYLKMEKFDESDAAFAHVLELDDEDKEQACIDIAYQFLGNNQTAIAIKYLQAGKNLSPDNKELLFELATAYLEQENYSKSIYYLNKQLDLDPYQEEAWFTLGLIYLDKVEEYDKAMEAFDFVTAINDKHEMAMFFKGQILFKKGDYYGAIEFYKEYGKFAENEGQAALLIAECYEELNNYEKAIEQYHVALEDEANRFDAWLGMGYSYLERKEYQKAIKYFKKILDENKEFEEASSGLGDCYLALGHEDLAIAAYEQSLKVNPEQVELWSVYADIFIGNRDYKKAISVIQKVLKMHISETEELRFQLSVCYFQMKQGDKAMALLKELKAQNFTELKKFYDFCPEARQQTGYTELIN